MKAEESKAVSEAVTNLRRRLGLPKDFLRDLRDGDDWSFVVKCHALLETTLGWTLSEITRPLPLGDFIATMDLSGGRHSKVELGRILNCLERDDVSFIRGLSKIRNRLVHNVRHVNFELKKYVAELPNDEQSDFVRGTCAMFCGEDDPKQKLKPVILSEPKFFLWQIAILVLAKLSSRAFLAEKKQTLNSIEKKLLEELRKREIRAREKTRDRNDVV